MRKRQTEAELRSKRRLKASKEISEGFQFLESSSSSSDEIGDFVVEDDIDTRALMIENDVLLDEENEIMTAFRILRLGRVDDFLGLSIIVKTFSPARQLLASFGPGASIMTQIWELKWKDMVTINCINTFKGTCTACGRKRIIRYVVYDKDCVPIAYIGSDCFEVKMMALINLIKFCLVVKLDYDEIKKGLRYHMSKVNEACIVMAEKYADLD